MDIIKLTLEQTQLISNWERIIKEVEEGTYEGGMPKSPAFKGFSNDEKIAYCNKMIELIKKQRLCHQ